LIVGFVEIIALKEAAALSAENRAHVLEQQMAQQSHTDLDTHKAWNTETATARKLRQEIARLKTAKDKAETSLAKSEKTSEEITRERIKALMGDR
jgi:hypothetical protein